jgi:DNA polymerase III epsilon subunit-like protein
MLQAMPIAQVIALTMSQRVQAIAMEWQELFMMSEAGQKVYIIDTETSGTSSADGVIELALIELHSKEVIFHQYYLPEVKINPYAYEVHGLSASDLHAKNAKQWDVLAVEEIEGVLNDAIVLEWGNSFDSRMVVQSCAEAMCINKLDYRLEGSWRSAMRDFALLQGFYTANKKGFKAVKLGQAAVLRGLTVDTAAQHSAIYDCELVQKIMLNVVMGHCDPDVTTGYM